MLKDLSDILQRKTVGFREEEENEGETGTTDGCIKAESTTGGHALHHGQESRGNDDVAAPAGDGVHHGSQGTNLEGEELGSNPGNGGNTGSEAGDVNDDGDENQDSGPVDGCGLEDKVFRNGNVVESNSGNGQAQSLIGTIVSLNIVRVSVRDSYHAGDGDEENDTASQLVNENKVNETEAEVGSADDDGDRGRLVEADKAKEGSRVVHESIETTELGDYSSS